MHNLRGPQFNLILRVKRSATQHWLLVTLLSFLSSLAVVKYAAIFIFSFAIKVIIFFLFLLFGLSAILLFLYLMRLHFTHRHRLELNEEGLFDYASFCELGVVPIKSIAKIRFSRIWGIEFLVIDFFNQLNPFKGAKGPRREVYHLLFGDQLWVPLNLFRMSRIDLESQLIHLDRILRHKNDSSNEPGLEAPPLTGVDVAVLKSKSTSLAERAAVKEAAPPPLTQIKPERQRVLAKVAEIKNQVRASGLDQQVTYLYFDHIAMFPAIAADSPEHLPKGVSEVRGTQHGADYEEVAFRFRGRHLSFGLRRDIGESDEALLSVGVSGRVHLSIKVKVEIGQLTPMELESFTAGEWQKLIGELGAEIERLEAKNQVQLPQTLRNSRTGLGSMSEAR
jgi:hypothetical protein